MEYQSPSSSSAQNMLRQLYLKAPFTVGIFRRSANARVCREVEASLEQDPLFSLEDVSVIVVGAVFKVSMLIPFKERTQHREKEQHLLQPGMPMIHSNLREEGATETF
jgi:hypothetical protein